MLKCKRVRRMAGVVVVVAVKPQLLADGTAQLLFITGETVPAVYHAHALTSYKSNDKRALAVSTSTWCTSTSRSDG